ncbi:MAG: hypothetical protein LQ340_002853 [Diploschistes diacapsis]|nr:MAG: hypothetical protein LQ340_002853 [Diploschistes diacapsis]
MPYVEASTQPKTEDLRLSCFAACERRLCQLVNARKSREASPEWMSMIAFESLNINQQEFTILEAILLESESKFPRITYDSLKGKARITYMASSLHESVTAQFLVAYGRSSADLEPDMEDCIAAMGSPTTRLTDKQENSKFEPDAAFYFRQSQTREKKLSAVVEVGLSQSYEDLCEVAVAWLNGQPSLQLVILVKITETPVWTSRSSVGDRDIEEVNQFLRPFHLDVPQIEPPLDDIDHPLVFKGLPLVNSMSMFIEFWKRDENGDPAQSGDRLWYAADSSDPLLVLGDLFPLSKQDGGDLPFALSWKRLKTALKDGRLGFADERYGKVRSWVRARASDSTNENPEY